MSAPVPVIIDLPVGLSASGKRDEFDSLGIVPVPAHVYWGAQTQRCLNNFPPTRDRMPIEVYRAYGHLKKAAARVNCAAGRMPAWMAGLIARVCDEVVSGQLDDQFPLPVWQSGSGTQSNMNVNEVIANRCIQLLGGALGSQQPVHPNDHVNMGQSSNDTFPTAMHLAAYEVTTTRTIPALQALQRSLQSKAGAWAEIVKTGRTHLQDAVPLTVGQQWSGYAAALGDAIAELERATAGLLEVAMGGTAVGTGLNSPPGFGQAVAAVLRELTGFEVRSAANKFVALATLDRLVRAHAALKAVSVTLFKIANDMRWMGSGPRTGLMELVFPANEPGSSMMPGKVNPTQAEALLMLCIRVMGADVAVQMAGAEGNFELNTFRPIVIDAYLHSASVMADMCDGFRLRMIDGAQLNLRQLERNIDNSLMLVTALSPAIGYDKAAEIAHYALAHDLDLRTAALAKGVSADMYDRVVVPQRLTRSDPGDPA